MEYDAATLRVGLQLGLVTVTEVVNWADERLSVSTAPSEDLAELSLMTAADPRDIISRLRRMSPGISAIDALPAALARGVERIRADPSLGPVVARGLYQLYVEANYQVPPELVSMGQFEDRYSLAKQGIYESERTVLQDLLTFAGGFSNAR